MSLLLPRTPNGTPANKPTQEIHNEVKAQIRKKADEAFGDLFRGRTANGVLENEADLVAGASAMLKLLNEIAFNPEEGEEMSLVPASWLFLLFSGRGLEEMYGEGRFSKTQPDKILEAIKEPDEEVNQ
jgi:hypothetical protein